MVGFGGHSPSAFQPWTRALVTSDRFIGIAGVKDWMTTLLYIEGYIEGFIEARMTLVIGRRGSTTGISGSPECGTRG
ncbi:hypothetical protein ACKS0A_00322 [Histoplasma ohiense]